jgi:hypothetical protein
MIYNNIEFAGVIEFTDRFNGKQLQRIPQAVRDTLNDRGRWNSQMSTGQELRFVCEAPHIRVFLSSLEGDAPVQVYCGDFHHSTHYLAPGGPLCIHLEPPALFDTVKPEALTGRRFRPQVWRIVLPGTQTVFHELESYGFPVRPPQPEEKPDKLWLAYGSSITAGGYVPIAAELMGVDYVNLAMGGACFLEPKLADFIAERDDWDVATFELGVNVRGHFTPEEFKQRAEYLVSTTLDKNPGKPVTLITTYKNAQDFEKEPSLAGERQQAFNAIFREIASQGSDNLHLIEGHELLADFSLCGIDLIHPSPAGHQQIARNLTERLAQEMQR